MLRWLMIGEKVAIGMSRSVELKYLITVYVINKYWCELEIDIV